MSESLTTFTTLLITLSVYMLLGFIILPCQASGVVESI